MLCAKFDGNLLTPFKVTLRTPLAHFLRTRCGDYWNSCVLIV